MIAKAIDKILQIGGPYIKQINGATYTSEKMIRVDNDLRAEPIRCRTLTGLVDYMDANKEAFNGWSGGYICRVVNEKAVELISELDTDRKRERIMIAEAETPVLPIGCFIDAERFLIGVQANFVATIPAGVENDLKEVLRFAGTVTSGTIREYSDDGVSQKATVKIGISTKAEKPVPSPAYLMPYRTFTELPQPASKFIFRMRDGNPPECALFEADGGAWKNVAMAEIKSYLMTELGKRGMGVPVIA